MSSDATEDEDRAASERGNMSRGTGDCVKRCLAAGVRVRVFPMRCVGAEEGT